MREDGEWMLQMMVRPRSVSRFSSDTMVKAVDESRPLVGSAAAGAQGRRSEAAESRAGGEWAAEAADRR